MVMNIFGIMKRHKLFSAKKSTSFGEVKTEEVGYNFSVRKKVFCVPLNLILFSTIAASLSK